MFSTEDIARLLIFASYDNTKLPVESVFI